MWRILLDNKPYNLPCYCANRQYDWFFYCLFFRIKLSKSITPGTNPSTIIPRKVNQKYDGSSVLSTGPVWLPCLLKR